MPGSSPEAYTGPRPRGGGGPSAEDGRDCELDRREWERRKRPCPADTFHRPELTGGGAAMNLDGATVEVDDPVVLHTGLRVEGALEASIVAQ